MTGDRGTDARSELARDTLLSMAAISLVGGSAAVYNVVVGRFLGDSVLGYAGLALAVGLGAAQLATAGLAPATTRFTAVLLSAGRQVAAKQALTRGMATAVAVGVLAAVVALATAEWWAEPIGLPAALIAPAVALIALQSGYLALKAGLYGVGRVGGYARSEVVAGVAFAVALIALVAAGTGAAWQSEYAAGLPTLTGAGTAAGSGSGTPSGLATSPELLLAPFVAANVVFIVLALWYMRRVRLESRSSRLEVRGRAPAGETSAGTGSAPPTPGPALDPSEKGPGGLRYAGGPSMPRYAAIAWVGSAAAMARVHLAVLATGLRWPASEVGMFQATLAFVAAVLLVPRAVELALFPALSRSFGSSDAVAFRRQLGEMLAVSVVALAAIAGALIVAGPELLALLYGPEFAGAQAALDGVVVSAWLLGLAVPAIAALSSANAVTIPNAAGVLGLLTSCGVWLWLVPTHGAAGAAAGLSAGSLVTFVLPMAAAHRLYDLPLAPAAAPMVRSLLLLAVAAVMTRLGLVPYLPAAVVYAMAVLLMERRSLAPLTASIRAAAAR